MVDEEMWALVQDHGDNAINMASADGALKKSDIANCQCQFERRHGGGGGIRRERTRATTMTCRGGGWD